MPLYFFNVFNGSAAYDDVGTDLLNVHEASKHSFFMAIKVMDYVNLEAGWEVEVLNDHGEIVSSMQLGALI